MKEADVHRQFSAWLNLRGISFIHSRTDQRTTTQRGDPDYLIAWKGRCLFIEIKVGTNKLSPVQEGRIAFIRSSGNRVEVCKTLDECTEAVEKILLEVASGGYARRYLDAVGSDECKVKTETYY